MWLFRICLFFLTSQFFAKLGKEISSIFFRVSIARVLVSVFVAICDRSSVSIRFTKRSSGSTVVSGISSIAPWSGHLDRVSDSTILVPGICSSLMSNLQSLRAHLACWSINRFRLR
jgi:hypothetical protein